MTKTATKKRKKLLRLTYSRMYFLSGENSKMHVQILIKLFFLFENNVVKYKSKLKPEKSTLLCEYKSKATKNIEILVFVIKQIHHILTLMHMFSQSKTGAIEIYGKYLAQDW